MVYKENEVEKKYDYPSKCNLCRNLVQFTGRESSLIQPKLAALSQDKWHVWGACLRPQREPRLLIRYYATGILEDCIFFEKGFFRESLDIPCPECKKGFISVTRPKINGHRIIILGCNRYPECRYTTGHIEMKTLCRYCGVPLVLTGDDLLECSCPKCNRSLSIPVSMKTWPGLIKPEGGCVHFENDGNCKLCDTSRTLRKSLLDLELPTLVKMGNRPHNNNTVPIINSLLRNAQNEEHGQKLVDVGDYLLSQEDYQESIVEDYLEKADDYWSYVGNYNTLVVENGDGSWETDGLNLELDE